MPPKTKKRVSLQVVNRPKRKRITTRRLIESDSHWIEHNSAPEAEGVRALGSVSGFGRWSTPTTNSSICNGRSAGGHSQVSYGQLRNTVMNSKQVDLPTLISIKVCSPLEIMIHVRYAWELILRVYVSRVFQWDIRNRGRPAPVFSIFDNVRSHVPTAIAGGYVDLDIVSKSHATCI